MKKFEFLKVYFSPFKPPKPKLYIGRVAYGVPVFYPRVWKRYTMEESITKFLEDYKRNPSLNFSGKIYNIRNSKHAEPKKIGFDFCGLIYKTKWDDTDYRFEFAPIWSFVFYKLQIAIIWDVVEESHYWESFLIYYYHTDKNKSKKQRIKKAKKIFPNVWKNNTREFHYWEIILKKKYKQI